MEQTNTDPAATPKDWQPRVIALVCNWCTYAGADLAGTSRIKYSPNVLMVRFPCTGRMNPLMIFKAFEYGADGVIVSGCHPGDCHYVQGNLVARRRFIVLRTLLDFIGIDLKRIHFSWVSAAEGRKWAEVVEQATEATREAGPMQAFEKPADEPAVELPPIQKSERPDLEPKQLDTLREHIRKEAADLLSSERVGMVIGYTAGSLDARSVPVMITSPEETTRLDWGSGCWNNLATYLPAAIKKAGRVAVMVKKCDIGAVIGLIRENQIRREDVMLVGAQCVGARVDGEFAVKCIECDGISHSLCDLIITAEGASEGGSEVEAVEAAESVSNDPRDEQIAYLESLPSDTRWQYWQKQFNRCLRCYACRAACPLCYCDSCIVEKHRPQWILPTIDNLNNTSWNITRALHLAGRCIGCDECARACPADIRIDLINRKLELEVARHFGAPTLDAEAKSILVDFRMDDPEDFVL
jgi:coenzyme F420-reducing hydrogenase delta subunit/heterodisulfide reductase subunit C